MTTPYTEFLDSASGFFRQGLDLLDPANDDYAILSGCLLLTVGLEKLIKHVLENANPLMILQKVGFHDLCSVHRGERVGDKQTITLDEAFRRLFDLFPQLAIEQSHVLPIIKSRNAIAHQAGHFDVVRIDRAVRVNVTDVAEAICRKCMGTSPREVFGASVWERMRAFREAYENAQVLELKERIAFLQRLYSQGEPLPCDEIEFDPRNETVGEDCPVCGSNAELEIGLDEDWDPHERTLVGVYRYFDAMKCDECGFTLDHSEEIEALLGKDTAMSILYGEPDY